MKKLSFLPPGLLAMLGASSILVASPVLGTTASEAFNRHFEAVGGKAAMEKVETISIQASGDEKGHAFDVEILLKRPGKILLIAKSGEAVVRQGRDLQARCWRQDPTGVKEMTDTEAGEFMNFVGGLFPPSVVFWGERMANSTTRQEREGERDLLVVGAEKDFFPLLAFDQKTGLLVRVGKTQLEDYRAVGQIRLPFLLRDGPSVTLRLKSAQLNVAVEDVKFERPVAASATRDTGGSGESMVFSTQQSAPGRCEIVRRPTASNYGRGVLSSLPVYSPDSMNPFQVDVRGADLSALDLHERKADLWHADFDGQTRWPASLPADFKPAQIEELGKDPGLGVRALHARGITGRGVGIGIIDQTLLVDHQEYADRLRLYEEIHNPSNSTAQMHGPAVASIALGKTIGVAPAAELYYIAEMHGRMNDQRQFDWDFTPLAQSIHRLLDVNAQLERSRKIRVISISVGWSPGQKGFAEANAAVERAKREGVFVISTSLSMTYQLAFHGLGRDPMADPNLASSYVPGSWWASGFRKGRDRFAPGQKLLVPMDARTTASPTGPHDYVYYSNGGWSWCVPWIAGVYALVCQVQPDITPEKFWAAALKSGQTIRLTQGTESIEFGTIADPVALIKQLQAAP